MAPPRLELARDLDPLRRRVRSSARASDRARLSAASRSLLRRRDLRVERRGVVLRRRGDLRRHGAPAASPARRGAPRRRSASPRPRPRRPVCRSGTSRTRRAPRPPGGGAAPCSVIARACSSSTGSLDSFAATRSARRRASAPPSAPARSACTRPTSLLRLGLAELRAGQAVAGGPEVGARGVHDVRLAGLQPAVVGLGDA